MIAGVRKLAPGTLAIWEDGYARALLGSVCPGVRPSGT